MDDWNKVLVYGSFDGFAYSTDDFPSISVVLDGGEKVEIPTEFVVSADQMVNKNKIKLKDVIARIEMLDLGTKAVWINEILNKLGSDYGLHKYYTGYKQGKFDGAMEREKVTVPQFVADWIEVCKEHLTSSLYLAMTPSFLKANNQGIELTIWIKKNEETFARAWLDGYTVESEKEKRYLVKMKNIYNHSSMLKLDSITGRWFFGSEKYMCGSLEKHTRKELEQAGFEWVFNCPGMEVEEAQV